MVAGQSFDLPTPSSPDESGHCRIERQAHALMPWPSHQSAQYLSSNSIVRHCNADCARMPCQLANTKVATNAVSIAVNLPIKNGNWSTVELAHKFSHSIQRPPVGPSFDDPSENFILLFRLCVHRPLAES